MNTTKFKDTNIPWLAQIPEHWDSVKLKYIAHFKSGETITSDDIDETGDYPVFGGNGLRGYTNSYTHEGEFVLIGRQGALCGNVNYAKGKFWASEHAVVASPIFGNQVDWLGEILRVMNLNQYSQAAAQPGLAVDTIQNLTVPVPPLDEQRCIAAYLDEQTEKIDRLMHMRRRQMALLKEQRSALIQQAVTRGLNPNVPMKDSGLPWLGAIPEHWEVKELRYLVPQDRQIMYGIVLPGPNVDDGVPIVKAGNCEPGRLSIDSMHRTTFEIESGYVRSRLRAGDIVYAIRGSFGEAEIVPPELEGANLTQDAARIAPKLDIHNYWLWHAVRSQSFFLQMDSVAVGATIRGVNIRDLKRGKLAVPPPLEQKQIADFIASENIKFDALHATYDRQLTLLTEYRAALIHECVTGQRLIPEAASP